VRAPEDISIGGTRVRFAGGWSAGDEMDLIVPSPERAWRIEAGSRPVRAPGSLYLLDSSGNTSGRFDIGGGMAGGARISDLAARTQGLVLVGGDEPYGASTKKAAVDVYVNDVGHEDRDGDGLGRMLEESLGTDPDNRDTDGDGLWDGFEVLGIRGAGLYPDQALPTWGADPRHKDVFVEADYYCTAAQPPPGPISCDAASAALDAASLNIISRASSRCSGGGGSLGNPDGRNGFSVHIDAGETLENSSTMGSWGGSGPAVFIPPLDPNWICHSWKDHMSPIRHGIFRHAVEIVSPGGGGASALSAPCLSFAVQTNPPEKSGKTFIHELGHAFSLKHWGQDEAYSNFNNKPNYISLMNYAYEFGSPNPESQDPALLEWDPGNIRFSEGERKVGKDVFGNVVEIAINPAAIDERVLFFESAGRAGPKVEFEHKPNWYFAHDWSGTQPRLFQVDWDRNGIIDEAPTKSQILIPDGLNPASIKSITVEEALDFGPQLVSFGLYLYLFYVPAGSQQIMYRIWHEEPGCDPEDIGPDGERGPIDTTPRCGSLSGESIAVTGSDISSNLSAVVAPANHLGAVFLFYLDTTNRLCASRMASSAWEGPLCQDVGFTVGPPEAVVFGDMIRVFGLSAGKVAVVTIDPTRWDPLPWAVDIAQVSADGGAHFEDMTSDVTPAITIDPEDQRLLGIVASRPFPGIAPVMQLLRGFSYDTFLQFEYLPNEKHWLDHPRGRPSDYQTDYRPAFVALAAGTSGRSQWTVWRHSNDPRMPALSFYSISSSFEPPPGESTPRKLFSRPSLGPLLFSERNRNVSLAVYKGKLRAAVPFEDEQGNPQGFVFLPLADGVFRAGLRDINDVQIIGSRMASTLSPAGFELFCDMTPGELLEIARANRLPPGTLGYRACVSIPPEGSQQCPPPIP
jgi:hypothetical protein